MDSKVFWFGTIFLILIIGIFSYLKTAQAEPEGIQLSNIESCASLHYSGEDRIDLLFISTKEEAQDYTNLLFETEPFKEYKSYFNVRVIEGENPVCEDYKGIAILCNTKDVKEISKRCEHDYVFVVKDEKAHIRSSSYGNVVSLNKNTPKSVLIHEIGHALASLAEEYAPAKVPRGAKNCKSSCEKFGELADSCSKECSESNLYRAMESSVMRTLITTEFGRSNVKILKDVLEREVPSSLAITGNQIQEDNSCNAPIVEVEITQSQDLAKAESTDKLTYGCTPDKAGEGDLCIGTLCYSNVIFTDGIDSETEELFGEVLDAPESTTIFIPADKGEVQITQNNNIIGLINTDQAGATACLI